jgi:GT2 family glycosyltransferase
VSRVLRIGEVCAIATASGLKFGAFVITCERPAVVVRTIGTVLSQSCAPSRVLVVDNSVDDATERRVAALGDQRISHHRVGANIGPAGAAAIGLEKLTAEGFEWIYWCDDDDPPRFEHALGNLLGHAAAARGIGVVGAVGQFFDKRRALVRRTPDLELSTEGLLDVDVVAGGMCMIVNAAVVRKGVLADPGLFMGFEEYDYCLRVKKAGFRVVVSRELFRAYRGASGRFGRAARPPHIVAPPTALWRRYYSTRNLIYILAWKERSVVGAMHVSARALGKAAEGFARGREYGCLNSRMEIRGLVDGWLGRMGRRVDPVAKYPVRKP